MTRSGSQSRVDRVTDALRQAIISREFEPGDRLSAVVLSNRFEVSQTPLREAFARLAGEGWLDQLPQRGVRVADFSIQELVEIYELRELLEPLALSRSVANGDDSWREGVERSYATMVDLAGDDPGSLDDDRYDAYEGAHTQFHRSLLCACGSTWLLRVTSMLSDQSTRFRRLSLPLRGRLGSVRDEHEALYRASLDGDATAAAQAALQHMLNTRESIRQWLEPIEMEKNGQRPEPSTTAVESREAAE